jgi:glycosyltransferase involved in cell wall biosynthesis
VRRCGGFARVLPQFAFFALCFCVLSHMRILLICYDSPLSCYSGYGMRTNSMWQALKRLADVSTLVMEPADCTELDTTVRPEELGRIRFNKPRVPWTTPETRKIRKLFAQLVPPNTFDLIVVRHLRLGMLIRDSIPAVIVVDADDMDKIEPTMGKSFVHQKYDALKTAARRVVSRFAMQGFEHIWYANPLDMIKYPADSGSVVPNVIDAPTKVPQRVQLGHTQLLMVGKFGYEPNAEGAEFFMKSVLPKLREVMPGIRLRLVGQCPAHLKLRWQHHAGVEVAGYVDDLALEYARACVVIAPVLSGGGTQIKVLEALAYSCGVVVSNFSAAGFEPHLRDGQHMLVAQDAQDWVAKCVQLIQSPVQAEQLGQAGREAVLNHYSIDAMTEEAQNTINRIFLNSQ